MPMNRLVTLLSLGLVGATILGGCQPSPPHSCSGAAVSVRGVSGAVAPASAAGDAGLTDGGVIVCRTADCRAYLQVVGAAIERNIAEVACLALGWDNLECVPASQTGCPSNTIEEGRQLEQEVRAYLESAWPELVTPDNPALDTCPCRIYEVGTVI